MGIATIEQLTILESLDDGITNVSYKAIWQNNLVAYRQGRNNPHQFGIDRGREQQFYKTASFLGISPEVLFIELKKGILVTKFIDGKTFATEDLQILPHITKLIGIIKTYHKINKKISNQSSYRPRLAIINQHFNELKKHAHLISKKYDLAKVIYLAEKLDLAIPSDDNLVFSHRDLYGKNIIQDRNHKIWLLDWEYADWGDKYYDLATLIAKNLLNEETKTKILELYFDKYDSMHKYRLDVTCALVILQTALWFIIQESINNCAGIDPAFCKMVADYRYHEFLNCAEQLLQSNHKV